MQYNLSAWHHSLALQLHPHAAILIATDIVFLYLANNLQCMVANYNYNCYFTITI